MIFPHKFQFLKRQGLLPFSIIGAPPRSVSPAEVTLTDSGRLEIPMLLPAPVEANLILQERVIPLELEILPKDAWLYGVNLLGKPQIKGFEVLDSEGKVLKGRLGVNLSEDWKDVDAETFFVAEHVEKHGRQEVRVGLARNDGLIEVYGEVPLVFRIWAAAHRCRVSIQLTELDEAGRRIGSKQRRVPLEALGGKARESYAPVVLALPADAARRQVRLEIIKSATDTDETDSYCFFLEPALYYGTEQTELANEPWLESVDLQTISRYDGFRYGCDLREFVRVNGEQTLAGELVGREGGDPILRGLVIRIPKVEGALIGVEGKILRGYGMRDGQPTDEITVSIDGHPAKRIHAAGLEHGKEGAGFVFEIPAAYLDGGIHVFELFVAGVPVQRDALAVPFTQTPYCVLQTHAGHPLPVALSPIATLRYGSTIKALRNLKGKAMPANYAQLEAYVAAPQESKPKVAPALTFDAPEKPDVSVVIPVHGKARTTVACLCALKLAWNEASMEIIIVDDGSTDETPLLLEEVEGIRVVRSEKSSGFIEACNAGADVAQGRFIVLLNNDTEPMSGWLDELIHVFERFEGVGVAGSKLIYPDGRLQEAGGLVWKTGDPWNYGREGNIHDPRYNYTRQCDYVSGAALMVPSDIWKEVGGLSREFIPAYFEDTDLCFKIREAGYKTVYCPLSKVVHYEGISNGTDVNGSGLKRMQEVNRPKFRRKWLKACKGFGEVGVDPDLNKDRGIEKRILVLDAQHPRPDQDAGSYAAVQEMRLLQSLGCKVTFVFESVAYLGQYTEQLQRMGVEVLFAPFYTSVQEVLEKRGSEFDLVYVTRYSVARHHLERLRRHLPKAKVLLCNADLHFLRELREAIAQKDPEKLERAVGTRDEELQTMREVDLVLSYNEVEHSIIMSHNLDSTLVAKCPWVVEPQEEIAPFESRSGLGFIGNYSHPPNEEAVRYFVTEVFPAVRERIPGVKFHVFGAGGIEKLEDLETEDVILEGFIEDLSDLYQRMRVFVCPLRSGAGIKGKVVTGLAHGLPSVLSPVAVEATGIGDGNEALVADRTQDWVRHIEALYSDQERWESMSQAARKLVVRKYGFEAGREAMREALEMVGSYHSLENAPLYCRKLEC